MMVITFVIGFGSRLDRGKTGGIERSRNFYGRGEEPIVGTRGLASDLYGRTDLRGGISVVASNGRCSVGVGVKWVGNNSVMGVVKHEGIAGVKMRKASGIDDEFVWVLPHVGRQDPLVVEEHVKDSFKIQD